MSAVNYARGQVGVVAVSMSWGSDEFSGETSGGFENVFTTPAGHTGVTFVAASGDDGAPGIWPAASPHVLSVGGTRLSADVSGNYANETGWSLGGGGSSTFFTRPSYQSGVYAGARRGSPDVAYDADPVTGFSVYNTYARGWEQIGGTSAGTPQWAALVAIVDQGRALRGLGSLDGSSQTLPALYSLSSADFHDLTGGRNGFTAGPGYDLVTGRGSPRANLVVRDLVDPVAVNPAPAAPVGPVVFPAGSAGAKVVGLTTGESGTDVAVAPSEVSLGGIANFTPTTQSAPSREQTVTERLRRDESERASFMAWLPPVDLSTTDERLGGDTSTADDGAYLRDLFAKDDSSGIAADVA
jgi:hypothetical protein